MNGLPYYKAYPRDFVEGTIGMTFELKGAYRLVLDLIYMQGGNLPDDARYISGLLGCSVKKWNALRAALLETGKIVVKDAYLTNLRAITEIESLGKFQAKQSENASTPRNIKDLRKPWHRHTDTESYKKEGGDFSRKKKVKVHRDDSVFSDIVRITGKSPFTNKDGFAFVEEGLLVQVEERKDA